MGVVTRRNLASRLNAQRLATSLHESSGSDYAVIETGDPSQPFKVDHFMYQTNAVFLCTCDGHVFNSWQRLRHGSQDRELC